MRPDTQLDYAIFQLTPTRTRCELHVAAQGVTYKLASGLLKPFVSHLRAAEEQLSRGGYSIQLEPPDPATASWFSKGTMERFVRFVSTPEVLERVSTVEVELTELEESIHVQTSEANEGTDLMQAEDHSTKKVASHSPAGGQTGDGPLGGQSAEDTSKQRLFRALDARRTMLQKEQGMAFARAIAAGFSIEHMGDLVVFAESFGAIRLREACIKFMALCKKRQESGEWLEDLNLAASESSHPDFAFMGSNVVGYLKPRDYVVPWLEGQGRDMEIDDPRQVIARAEKLPLIGDEVSEKLTRRGSLDELTGESLRTVGVDVRPGSGYGPTGGVNGDPRIGPMGGIRTLEDLQGAGAGFGEDNKDSVWGASLVRGHPMMAAWQGQVPDQFIPNAPQPLLRGAMHPSFPTPYGFSGPSRAAPYGPMYPAYLGGPYLQPPNGDNFAWQGAMSHAHPLPPQYWPGIQGHNDSPWPSTEHATMPVSQIQNALGENSPTKSSSEYTPVPKLSGGEQQISDNIDQGDSPNEGAGEVPLETRRLPRRSASPSRRSSSPMRRVQIGRASPRRSGMVVIRNINYIAPNAQNQQAAKGDSDNDSPGSWCEDGEDSEGETLKTQAEAVRVNVQDVIGLFENKKPEAGKAKKKPSKEEGRKPSLKSRKPRNRNGDGSEEHEEACEVPVKLEEGTSMQKEHFVTETDIIYAVKTRRLDSSMQDMAELEANVTTHMQATEQETLDLTRKEAVPVGSRGHVCDDMLMLAEDERQKRPSLTHINEFCVDCEHQDGKRPSLMDDSFVDIHGGREVRSTSGSMDPDFGLQDELSRDVELHSTEKGYLDDSFIVLDHSSGRERGNMAWRTPFSLESEMPCDQHLDKDNGEPIEVRQNFEPDDLFMVPERNVAAANRTWNAPMDGLELFAAEMAEDVQIDQEQQEIVGVELVVENEHEIGDSGIEANGGQSDETSGRKGAEHGSKAKAMQEVLERRRLAGGKRSTPLAEAQLRAEKLREYKAGLQKSKKEKDEEERKRIEDLKNQRRERIAARSSPVVGTASSIAKTSSRTSIPTLSKSSSPTLSHSKINSSSARQSSNGVSKASSNPSNRVSRPLLSSIRKGEHPLSRSAPSLTELRKESRKLAPLSTIRSSTGSQRLSVLKKGDKDSLLSIKANGHTEERKRPASSIARKGIPPAKDLKGQISPLGKTIKAQNTSVSKPQKKPNTTKKPPAKKETAPVQEEISFETATASEAPPVEPERNGVTDSATKIFEVEGSPFEGDAVVQENDHAQIKSLLASKSEAENATYGYVQTEGTTLDALKVHEDLKEDVLAGGSSLHAHSQTGSDDGHMVFEASSPTDENDHAPVALLSPKDDDAATYLRGDGNGNGNGGSSTYSSTPLPQAVDQYDPLSSESALSTPSNLPCLHEVIQQVHSPEAATVDEGSTRSRKKWGDSAKLQKSSKGLKRLLLLGRKSSRSSVQNVNGVLGAGLEGDGDNMDDSRDSHTTNGKHIGSSLNASLHDQVNPNASAQPFVKAQGDNGSGSSATKSSRSFFSLSSFRGKSEAKA